MPATSPFSVRRDIPYDWRMCDRAEPWYPLLCEARRVLAAQPDSYWRRGMLLALSTLRFSVMPYWRDPAGRIANPRGFTIPLLGNTVLLREDIAGRVDCESLQILLHELAHRCGAVLPEWKLWFPRFFDNSRIYGRRINSADAISMAMLEHYCPCCRWPD